MTSNAQSSFKCPTCDALYQVVKINAGQEATGRETTCQVCGAQFPARQGLHSQIFHIAESWPSPKMGAAKASTQVSCTRLIQIKNGRDRRCLDGSPIPGRRINSVVSKARQKGGFFATILLRYTQSGNAITWIPARGLGATIRKLIEEAFGWIKTVAGQEKTRFQSREIVGRRGEGEGKADAADPSATGQSHFPGDCHFHYSR